jgi:hypothetical protein
VTEHGQAKKVDCLDHALREGAPPPLPAKRRRYAIHPLFPLPEGVEETQEIYAITFDRWDHQGRKERCPDRFLASELTSLAQVVDRFGGGTYQFIAFDRRGAFSRWTAEKDKVRFGLPCKPLRQVEPQSGPVPAAPRAAPPNRESDLIPLLIAAQRRTDLMLIAAQERTDRMLLMLAEHLATRQAPRPAPTAPATVALAPPAPAPIDPMVMLMGLATILEKLRPAPSGNGLGQLAGLVGVVKQLAEERSPSAAEEQADLQKCIATRTNTTAERTVAPASPPAAPHGGELIWVYLPDVGPVMMRLEQAVTVLALSTAPSPPASIAPSPSSAPAAVPAAPAAPSAPRAPAPAARPFLTSWEDVAARLRDPAEQRALKQAIERVLASSAPAASTDPPTRSSDQPLPRPSARPVAAPPAPRMPAPAVAAASASAPPNAPCASALPNVTAKVAVQLAAPPAALSPSKATPAASQATARLPETLALALAVARRATCMPWGAPGGCEPAQANVLSRPNSPRSLPAPASRNNAESRYRGPPRSANSVDERAGSFRRDATSPRAPPEAVKEAA